ncbi:hypothetical protein D3C75_1259980 [compost metagenome]
MFVVTDYRCDCGLVTGVTVPHANATVAHVRLKLVVLVLVLVLLLVLLLCAAYPSSFS